MALPSRFHEMALEGLIFRNSLLSSLGQRVFIVIKRTGDVDDKDFVILFNDDVSGDLSKSRGV